MTTLLIHVVTFEIFQLCVWAVGESASHHVIVQMVAFAWSRAENIKSDARETRR